MKKQHAVMRPLAAAAMAVVFGMSHAADRAETGQSLTPAQQAARLFGETDSNGDGQLTADEFALFNHLNSAVPTSPQDIRATRIMNAFRAMDASADGLVSGEEYTLFMEKNGR